MNNNYDGHLLLEDDAYIIEDRWENGWDQAKEEIIALKGDWDLIYLGWHAFEYENNMHAGRNLIIEERYKNNKKFYLKMINHPCSGMHGVLVNQRHYERMYGYTPTVPIDSQWNNDRSLKRYMIQPKLIGLHSCFSMCEQSFVNRDIL